MGGLAIVVLAGLAFLLFGSTSTQLTGPIAQAATLSSSTPGYRMHMSMELTSSQLSEPIVGSGSGTIDLRDHASSLSLAMNLGADPQVTQTLGSNTMRIKMILDGTVMYMQLPPAVTASMPMAGKQWIKIDLAKLAHVPGLSSLESNPTTSDPSHTLQYLRSVSDGVVNEGEQRVDGFDTTHYRADLNLARAVDELPAADRTDMQQELSTLQQDGQPTDFPVDVWVDAHHLVRRIVMAINPSPNGVSMQETMTMDLSDYGPQPRPATPPAYEVEELSGLSTAASG